MQREPTLSVIVPTDGRPTLRRTLESVVPQLEIDDEVLVVADGATAHAAALRIVRPFKGRCLLRATEETGSWGNAQRDHAMALATGTHLTFMDDDDVYAPNALVAVRTAVAAEPDAIHIFRMRAWNGELLPRTATVTSGNVGTPMIVVPNVKEKLGRWVHPELSDQGRSDFAFISETIDAYSELIWHDEVIALCRPTRELLVEVGSTAAGWRDTLALRFPGVALIYRVARRPLRLPRR